MKKTHEEEWALDDDGDVRRLNARGERTSLVCLRAATGTLEAQHFIAAAPEMARALLAFLPEGGHTLECGNVTGDEARCSDECRSARDALRSAGVL